MLEAPIHGSVEMSGITYGAVATYACDHSSFRINGPLNRQCLSDGRWNGKDPTCDLKGKSFLAKDLSSADIFFPNSVFLLFFLNLFKNNIGVSIS